MDWATVVSIAITGVVGVAGVAGTLLSVRIASNAENQRLREAEKRRTYAAYRSALNRLSTVGHSEDNTTDRGRAATDDAIEALDLAEADVALIAPKHINDLVYEIGKLSADYYRTIQENPETELPDEMTSNLYNLFIAMRADLSYPY
jgi:hypothetical protein